MALLYHAPVAPALRQVVYCRNTVIHEGDSHMAELTPESVIDTLNDIDQRIQEIQVRL